MFRQLACGAWVTLYLSKRVVEATAVMQAATVAACVLTVFGASYTLHQKFHAMPLCCCTAYLTELNPNASSIL